MNFRFCNIIPDDEWGRVTKLLGMVGEKSLLDSKPTEGELLFLAGGQSDGGLKDLSPV